MGMTKSMPVAMPDPAADPKVREAAAGLARAHQRLEDVQARRRELADDLAKAQEEAVEAVIAGEQPSLEAVSTLRFASQRLREEAEVSQRVLARAHDAHQEALEAARGRLLADGQRVHRHAVSKVKMALEALVDANTALAALEREARERFGPRAPGGMVHGRLLPQTQHDETIAGEWLSRIDAYLLED